LTDTIVSEKATSSPALSEVERLIGKGQLREAKQICRQALSNNPKNHAALFWGGIVALEYKKFPDAEKLFSKAISLDASRPEYHASLGRALIALKQVNEARQAADKALALEPEDARTLDTIGVVYSYAGEHTHAAQIFRRVVKLDSSRDSYWYNLGTSLKFSGLFDEAERAYNKALELNPKLDKALYALSDMRTQTPDSNHIELLKKRLDDKKNSLNNELALSYALAKECDDTGEYATAFATLNEANRRYRQSVSYNFSDNESLFEAMLDGFDAESIATTSKGDDSGQPIFIVVMPRSGTTLTDRILSAHSEVNSAGELILMPSLIRLAAKARNNKDFKPAIIRSLLGGDLNQLGRKYLEAAQPAAGGAHRCIDKMPLNFFYVGFILLALPKARIVCLRRNPLDTCLGNFRQLFALNNIDYAWAYDLLDCGRYYVEFDKLMRHWDELFPGRIHTVNYEELVSNQEPVTRELVDYCGLEWEDQCLHFEDNTAPVATASSAQVREPLNRKGLNRWKNYAQELQPLVDFLREHNIEVDS
jgi:Flp pilus assembly protein TadD